MKRSSKSASKNKQINAYIPKGVQKQTWQAAVDGNYIPIEFLRLTGFHIKYVERNSPVL